MCPSEAPRTIGPILKPGTTHLPPLHELLGDAYRGRGLLRPLALEDAEALFEAYGDPEVCRYWSRPEYASVEETREALAWEIAHGQSWSMVDAKDGPGGPAMGRISLFKNASPGVVEIGVIMARKGQGRGLAGDAVRALVAHAFKLGMHRVFADTDPDNLACIRLFERAGFVREAFLRKAWKTHLGLRDGIILARLSPEAEAHA